jgi:HAD superfamily hydrolase (TIGR01484 family)
MRRARRQFFETRGRPELAEAFREGWLEVHRHAQSRRGAIAELFVEPALKLLARHEELGYQEFWDRAAAATGDRAVITWSSTSSLLEISAAGVTKATTLAVLAEQLGIDPEEVVAFGDMPNDIDMLTWAGTSYAMTDAHPTVRAAADRIAPSNDEDGVASVLSEIFGL